MLSIEKIFAWPDKPLSEISGRLQPMTMATAKHGLSSKDWEKLMRTQSHSQRRGIEDLAASKKPSAPEISAAYVKIIEEVRLMIKDGYLRVEKFAPEIYIEDNFEEKLGRAPSDAATATSSEAPQATTHTEVPDLEAFGTENGKDIATLRLKLQQLNQENTTLKTENRTLKERLTQIKKLAA